jgi:ribosomal-protein-serine acetyltransferase
MLSLGVAPNIELRWLELHHAKRLFDLVDQHRMALRPFLRFVDQFLSLRDAEDVIERSRRDLARGVGLSASVWVADELAGMVSLFDLSTAHHKAELEVWLAPPFWGRGIGSKVVAAVVAHSFGELELNRIQLRVQLDNAAARRVAQNLGFELEGVMRHDRIQQQRVVSHEVYSMLVRDWRGGTLGRFTRDLGDGAHLRLLEARHASHVFDLINTNRSHLRRFLPWVDGTREVQHSREFIQSGLRAFAGSDGADYGIWQDDQLAGIIGLHFIDWTHQVTQFGYWLGEGFTGRGLMTRAGRAILQYAFSDLGLRRINVAHALENTASRAVIERLGFVFESETRDAEWMYDRFLSWRSYGLLREEWLNNRGDGSF